MTSGRNEPQMVIILCHRLVHRRYQPRSVRLRRQPANNVTVDGEHTGLGTVAQSGATRATKLVAKNAEKATTTNGEKKAAQETPVSNTRVSHLRRKDQVADDPQSAAKPDEQFAIVEPAVGRPQLAQVQNPGSKKCCVLAILLSDLPQKRPHSNNNTTFSSSSHLSIQP